MHKKSDVTFYRYGSDIRRSAGFIDQITEDQSPILNVQATSPMFTSKQLFCLEPSQCDNISIEDEMQYNSFSQYKCYKCYGVRNSGVGYSLPLCEQCEGSQVISQINPIVSLLQRVLKKKLPFLLKKQDKLQTQQANANKLLCAGCVREHPKQNCYSCALCKNYYLCTKCVENGSFTHPQGHRFSKIFNQYSIKVKQTLPNMKKISEEYQYEEAYYNEDEEMKCALCSEDIEDCYLACLNCQQQSKKFIICSKCQDSQTSVHIRGHSLELRTLKMESRLPELFAKPSGGSTTSPYVRQSGQQAQNAGYPYGSRQMPINSARSIVSFPHLDLDESNEIPYEDLRCSQTQVWSPPTHRNSTIDIMQEQTFNPQSYGNIHSPKKIMDYQREVKGFAFGNESMVSIRMQDSEDLLNHQYSQRLERKSEIPLLTPFAFSNNSKDPTKILARPQKKDEEDYIFKGYRCDICLTEPIKNLRYHCKQCEDYDLCNICYLTRVKNHEHQAFEEIDGKAIKKQRQLRMTKARESLVRQTFIPVRKSTMNFALVPSRVL